MCVCVCPVRQRQDCRFGSMPHSALHIVGAQFIGAERKWRTPRDIRLCAIPSGGQVMSGSHMCLEVFWLQVDIPSSQAKNSLKFYCNLSYKIHD